MTTEANKIITKPEECPRTIGWLNACVNKILEAGPAEVVVRRFEQKRSIPQNKRLWPMLSDVATQVMWGGQYLTPDDWKDIFSAAWKQQEIVPGINGGFVVLGVRTSKMRKREFSELIEIIYAFGSGKGVVWSDPALKAYELYREAQK